MDGNGRWAQKKGLNRLLGHRQGLETIRTLIDTAIRENLSHMTLYAFSVENWNRPQEEIDGLMKLFVYYLKHDTKTLLKKGVQLNTIGQLDNFPQAVKKELNKSILKTKNNNTLTLTLALGYGSRTEIIDAIKNYTKDVLTHKQVWEDLDWDILSKYLYTHDMPDPDLILRTSGEQRISNFLLLQGAYAELYFTETAWPEFSPKELEAAIRWYRTRQRRFGLIAEQIETSAAPTPSFTTL